MADEFQLGSGNWWETSRSRFDGETTSATVPTTLSAMAASFGWPIEVGDMKPPRPNSIDSDGSMLLQGADHAGGGGGGGVLADHNNLQMMGLGLPSQGFDWNPTLLGEKGESSFRSMIQQEDHLSSSNTTNFQQHDSSSQQHWTQKLYSGGTDSPDDSAVHNFRQLNRGFSLDQAAASSNDDSTITSGHNFTTGFQLDCASAAASASAAAAAYGLLLPENQSQAQHAAMNFPYPSPSATGLISSWNKFPQSFLRTSPPPPPPPSGGGTHLHFTNNTPFWNASARTSTMSDARSSFFPDIQTQIPTPPTFDEKPKSSSDLSTSTTKKSSTETTTSNKRGRNETPSPLPAAFKVRKEKMGDRITALQQLVSPFGKTDTASVLSEAIEYIKFLHEQVLSTPYMKNGAPMQQQQHQLQNPGEKSNKHDPAEGVRQDLRSRGLCLVPVSSTFPMTHETTVDFWTPTFGASFR
ncbi:transcription factor bHLH123-like isoform X2 [Andrographis paniculata]|uniref:transcription factor bHLH123-like isoform X2 n=1 Tax=Andrographis paniculata TaxID=175694 RepID=UPI0021E9AA4D|nr:transcription factor bHLH123-like isoform X2 [Andrographis paniculata]